MNLFSLRHSVGQCRCINLLQVRGQRLDRQIQIDVQMDRQIDGKIDRQTEDVPAQPSTQRRSVQIHTPSLGERLDGQIDRKIDRQIDREIYRQIEYEPVQPLTQRRPVQVQKPSLGQRLDRQIDRHRDRDRQIDNEQQMDQRCTCSAFDIAKASVGSYLLQGRGQIDRQIVKIYRDRQSDIRQLDRQIEDVPVQPSTQRRPGQCRFIHLLQGRGYIDRQIEDVPAQPSTQRRPVQDHKPSLT